METRATLGIIGGSGLYQMDGIENRVEVRLETPYGPPSDAIVCGTINGTRCAFIPRHGRGHVLTPSEVNYRANVWALKSLGVRAILSVSAVGSLREKIEPGHLVCPDQFIDRTRGRAATFFGDGVVGHVQFGEPIEEAFRQIVLAVARRASLWCTMEVATFVLRDQHSLRKLKVISFVHGGRYRGYDESP